MPDPHRSNVAESIRFTGETGNLLPAQNLIFFAGRNNKKSISENAAQLVTKQPPRGFGISSSTTMKVNQWPTGAVGKLLAYEKSVLPRGMYKHTSCLEKRSAMMKWATIGWMIRT